MKTSMKIFGNISLALIMFGTVFKIMHWPGAGIILTGGFAFICAIFFPMAIYVNYKKVSQQKNLLLHIVMLISGITFMLGVIFKIQLWPFGSVLLLTGYMLLICLVLPLFLIDKVRSASNKKDQWIYVLGFISLIIFATSSMFKFFHWPGAAILMIVGAFLLVSIFLPLYTWRSIQQEGRITGQFIYIIIAAMFLVMFTSLLAINASAGYLDDFIAHGQNEKQISNYLAIKNSNIVTQFEAENDSLSHANKLNKIHLQANEISEFITAIKIEMLLAVEKDNPISAEILIEKPELIHKKAQEDHVYSILVGKDKNGKAYKLKEKLSDFKVSVLALDKDENYRSIINKLINLDDKTKWGQTYPWEWYHFNSVMFINALGTLDEVNAKVRTAESVALKQITKSVNQ